MSVDLKIASRDGYHALALAIVYHAVREMRDTGVQSEEQLRPLQGFGKERLRLDATVWLASKAAVEWFDHIGVEQLYGLWKMGWQAHAEELLADEFVQISSREHLVLELGLDAMSPTNLTVKG